MNYFFELKDFTNLNMNNCHSEDKEADHDKISIQFKNYLKQSYDNENFCKLLSCAGFIPDLYLSDSSEETLFSKLTEVLVSEWADRMNFSNQLVKEKSGHEDVNLKINDKIVVCDAKSFRLGRSQAAPNVKDFLKPADVSKWLERHKNGLGGLITYPDTHDWTKSSDVYLYCTDKNCPTVILPYIYLAMLLHFKSNYSTSTLENLWNYKKLFPKRLEKKTVGGNRAAYWKVIDKEIISILNITEVDFRFYFQKCKDLQTECIKKNIEKLRESKKQIIKQIEKDCDKLSVDELRKNFLEYKIKVETQQIDEFISRIVEFRLKK